MKFIKKLLFFILGCLLCSCSSAPKPPDIFVFESLKQRIFKDPVTEHLILRADPVCMKEIKEVECGHGVSIMTGKQIFIGDAEAVQFNKKPWSQLKNESILIPAVESYAPLAAYIINVCTKFKCSDDVSRFKIKVDSLRGLPAPKDAGPPSSNQPLQ